MIKVYQSRTLNNDGTGDCFNACVASILEIPLSRASEVTPESEGVWYLNWKRWCKARGWLLEVCSLNHPPAGYGLISVKTKRVDGKGNSITHACVCFDGQIVHDPFPGGSEIMKKLYYHSLTRIKG